MRFVSKIAFKARAPTKYSWTRKNLSITSRELKKNGQFNYNERLISWPNYPIEEVRWRPKPSFMDKAILKPNLEEGQPVKVDHWRLWN